ncbi:unnamed protein product, partial [marine sediment metagenome]
DYGVYNPYSDVVVIGKRIGGKQTQLTRAHEFQHAMDTRGGIDAIAPYGSRFGKAVQEIRAEWKASEISGKPGGNVFYRMDPMKAGADIGKKVTSVGIGKHAGTFKQPIITRRFVRTVSREAKAIYGEDIAFRKNFPATKGAPSLLVDDKVGITTLTKSPFGKAIPTKPISSFRTVGVQTSKQFGVPAAQPDISRFELGVTRQAVRVGKELRGRERIQIRTGGLTVKADFPRSIERFEALKVGGVSKGGISIKQTFTPPPGFKTGG